MTKKTVLEVVNMIYFFFTWSGSVFLADPDSIKKSDPDPEKPRIRNNALNLPSPLLPMVARVYS